METERIPAQIGPYRILDELGHGGMGVVYRGIHQRTGELAAIKTVHLAREGQMESIRREIRALARIRHTGVVRIMAEGQQRGLPWYAMELLDGPTLRQFALREFWSITTSRTGTPVEGDADNHLPSRWWTQLLATTLDSEDFSELPAMETLEPLILPSPESRRLPAAGGNIQRALLMIHKICMTLAYLHGEGIVHRDLKPANILIRHPETPVIMDFGLMFQFWGSISRDQLSSPAVAGGTLLYIAPEQIRDEVVDARADLYAMGCIMYEILTGHVPFRSASISQIIKAQLSVTPPRPSEIVDGVPPGLDDIVMALLEKNPRKRLGHAMDLAIALEKFGKGISGTDDYPKPKAYLYRPSFVNRRKALDELEKYISGDPERVHGMMLIGGETGIGKTRLLMEIAKWGKRRKLRIITAECHHLSDEVQNYRGSAQPLQPLRKLLQSAVEFCAQAGPEAADRIFGIRGPVLALYEPQIAALPGQSNRPPPPDLPPNSAQLRLFTYLIQTILEYITHRPILLLIDDLHWADDLTIGFLTFLLHTGQMRNQAFHIVSAFRSEELTEGLKRLRKSPNALTFDITRLSREDAGEMIADMMGIHTPSPPFLEYITKASEGNPFFIAEYLRSAVSEGLIFRGREGKWEISPAGSGTASRQDLEKLPLPTSIHDLTLRRLEALPASARIIADIAAVVGKEMDIMLIWQVITFSEDILDAIDELIRRQIIEETIPGKIRFVNNSFRDLAYERIPRDQLRFYHSQVARALEDLYPEQLPDNLEVLAVHWEKAGEPRRAAAYYIQASDRAHTHFSLSEGERFLTNFIRLSPPRDLETVQAKLKLARNNQLVRARYIQATEHLKEARSIAREEGFRLEEIQALMGLSEAARISGDARGALELVETALSLTRDHGFRREEAVCLRNLGRIRLLDGLLDNALSLLELALHVSREVEDPSNEATTLALIARVHSNLDNFETARKMYHNALELHRAKGNKIAEGPILTNIAVLYNVEGHLEQALRLYQDSLEHHRGIGDRRSEAGTLSNIAGLLGDLNRPEDAMPTYEQALAIQREIGDPTMEGKTLRSLAIFLHNQEKYPDTVDALNKAIKLHQKVNDRYSLIRAYRQMSWALANLGRPDDALEYMEKAVREEQEIKHRWSEKFTMLQKAKLLRLLRGEYGTAGEMIEEVQNFAERTANASLEILCCCEMGILALATDQSPDAWLQKIDKLMKESRMTESSDPGQAVSRFRRTVEWARSGNTLIHGESPEVIDAGLLRWYRKSGFPAGKSGSDP